MNWKDRYSTIKVGDKVKVLKSNHLCMWLSSENCCEGFVGQICEVIKIEEINKNTKGTISILAPTNVRCSFPAECLQKVI